MATLNVSITIPDSKVAAVIDALAYQNGYTDMVEDDVTGEIIPNPVTKLQWIKAWNLGVVRASWKAYNDMLAKQAALVAQDEDGSDFS